MILSFSLLLSGCAESGKGVPAADPPAYSDTGPDTDTDTGADPVDADGDGATAATDCDDADPRVFPGAAELCDGADGDCDPATTDAGRVAHRDAGGEWTDETALFVAGTSAAPAALALDGGDWYVCAGTWYVELDVTGTTTVTGVSGAAATVLTAAGHATVVSVHGPESAVTLGGLTVRDGQGSGGTVLGGGGAACVDGASLTMSDLVFTNNFADVGGAVLVDDCTLSADAIDVRENVARYGGGVYAFRGTLAITNSSFTLNSAASSGGGIGLEGAFGAVSLALADTVVEANTAEFGAGLVLYEDATATCSGSGTGTARFVRNGGADTTGGGVYLTGASANPTFEATLCDFGDGDEDNAPTDVTASGEHVHAYAYGSDATFACDTEGCE